MPQTTNIWTPVANIGRLTNIDTKSNQISCSKRGHYSHLLKRSEFCWYHKTALKIKMEASRVIFLTLLAVDVSAVIDLRGEIDCYVDLLILDIIFQKLNLVVLCWRSLCLYTNSSFIMNKTFWHFTLMILERWQLIT